MRYIEDLNSLSKNDVLIAGGKGASLGEMTQSTIPVPAGFVILASSFEKFLQETDLNVEIDAILDSVIHKEIHAIEDAAEKIQTLILGAEMPRDIASEIKKFFKNLGTKYIAVRSSATAEDSASAAWAGQLESYLNTTEEGLLENVKKCWASLFTPRAIFYRFEKDLHKQKISVAVVVQKMIESEKSGIAFSVHPVTQDKNKLIIEAGFGLGEAIVSGQITPDSYVIEKQPRRIIDKNVQTQSRGLYRAEKGGNEWRDISNEQGEKQVLSDKEILELSEIILKIENHYNFPCDIEWAFEKGKFYVVQSRPITTLQKHAKLRPLAKIITREAPLIGVESWYNGIIKENERFFNITFPENFFVFRKGTVESWRDSVQLGITPLELSQWVKENRDHLIEGYNRQKATLKLIASIKSKALKTEEEIMDNLGEIRDSFSYGFPGIVVAYLIPLWQEIHAVKGDKLFDDEILKKCIEWRKETDPFFDQSIETIYYLLAQLCKLKKWNIKLVKYIRYQELVSAVKTGLSEKKLKERGKSTFAYIDGQLIFESNFDIELTKKGLFMPKEAIPGSKEIKGSSANPGSASGKVKVVFAREELNKVYEGDILVAPMTTPWYLPAMKKAAAVVTDEGGITCHAAIMAREMNKPCVIGTKIATRILKDGDKVEVDANNGIVSILK